MDFPLDAGGEIVDSVYYGKWIPNGPQRLARGLVGGPDLAIYFDCGTSDDLHLFPFNTAFAETLTTLGIPFRFRTIQGGHHIITAASLSISFEFADSVMRAGSQSYVGGQLPPLHVSQLRSIPTPSCGRSDISFVLDRRGRVTLDIVDVAGREVVRLLNGDLDRGVHSVTWDGEPEGVGGVYFARLRTKDGSAATRIVLTR